jgi:DnaJ-class molecular chaperone
MDYYTTLGISKNASEAEIKAAYRKMAMKHHPDRGGDEKTFKEVNAAYETLSDPQKKQMIDMGVDPNSQHTSYRQGSPFEFHFNTGNFDDIFSNFGFGGRPMRKNKTLNVNIEVTLEDILKGKVIDAEIGIPGGVKKLVSIEVPPGIENGQQIRYRGMGEHTLKDVPPGDLIVNIFVRGHSIFQRQGDMLMIKKFISPWDAILGSDITIETIDKKTLTIGIPAGTQTVTVLSCRGEGLPNMRTKVRGNLLIKIQIEIPKNLSSEQKTAVELTKLKFS